MKSIKINTISRNYEVILGNNIIKGIPEFIKSKFAYGNKIIIISNEKIYGIYGNTIEDIFSKSHDFATIILKDGEKYKNLDILKHIYSKLVSLNAHRNDILIAFGGGVIGDTAGFAAATFNRGMNLVQLPTTIMSQTDSSIGGKVAVNFNDIKNVIGSFYQPHLVITDTSFPVTLDEKEIINGLGEIVKYGLVFDYGIIKDLLNIASECENENERLYEIVKNNEFSGIIYKCVKIKSAVVEKDEFDLNERQLLNFGHTIGHALEKAASLEILNHGQAVALGMLCAVEISINLGYLDNDFKKDLLNLYRILKLPLHIAGINKEKIFDALKYDKKFLSGINKFILLEKINKPVIMTGIDENIIKSSIINYII